MSLTFGPGPFSSDRAGVLSAGELPPGTRSAEPYPRRVRIVRDGDTVVDSNRGWLVHEPGRPPSLWFPPDGIGSLDQDSVRVFGAGEDPMAAALQGFMKVLSRPG